MGEVYGGDDPFIPGFGRLHHPQWTVPAMGPGIEEIIVEPAARVAALSPWINPIGFRGRCKVYDHPPAGSVAFGSGIDGIAPSPHGNVAGKWQQAFLEEVIDHWIFMQGPGKLTTCLFLF